jgi:carbonic anhydrase
VDYQDFPDAKLEILNGKSLIQMYNKNVSKFKLNKDGLISTEKKDSDLYFVNEFGEPMIYHFEYLQWKVPSEHNIDNRQVAAELQIYHTQRAGN